MLGQMSGVQLRTYRQHGSHVDAVLIVAAGAVPFLRVGEVWPSMYCDVTEITHVSIKWKADNLHSREN